MKVPLLLALSCVSSLSAPITLHVATNGNDNATGTSTRPGPNGPLATLDAALRSARARPRGQGAIIYLHRGIYRLNAPIVLRPEDSGASAEHPLVIAGYKNEKPVLSGGVPLKNWKEARAGLWQTDAKAQLGADWQFRSLFIAGRRAIRARTPNEGELFTMQGARLDDQSFQFKFRRGDILPGWALAGDVELVAFEKWTDVRQYIRVVNTTNNIVTLSGSGSPHTRESGARYYIENAPEALDTPGEWRLDRQTGLVSALFRPEEDPNKLEIVVPHLSELLQIAGDIPGQKPVRHVILRGLTFSETDAVIPVGGYRDTQAAVAVRGDLYADGMTDCAIENCRFTRLAGYGIDLGRGCQRNRIVGNELADLGAGGVRLGETTVRTNSFDATHSNTIMDNHLHHLGRLYPPAVGVLILQSASNHIAFNHIHDLYYTAVSVGWTWGYRDSPCHHNVIEFNHLHDVGLGMLSDMGAVYTLGPQPGTVVRNNLIHDVTSFTYGGWGLYTDEGSTGIVLESNIVYRCKSAGFHQHYGKENIVRNNIFAFNRENQLMRSREEGHISFYFTNNIVLFDSGNLLGSTWKNDRFVLERNLYYNARVGTNVSHLRFAEATLGQWQLRGHDTNSLVADPQFRDAARDDFRWKKGAPAERLGIGRIPTDKVGIRVRD